MMPAIKGPVLRGRSDRKHPHAYLWCSRITKGRILGLDNYMGANCVIEVAGTKPCTRDYGGHRNQKLNCIETAHIYEGGIGKVYWRQHGGKK